MAGWNVKAVLGILKFLTRTGKNTQGIHLLYGIYRMSLIDSIERNERGSMEEKFAVIDTETTWDDVVMSIGIVIADALFGEITPKMAVAVGQAEATRILLPLNKCDNLVAGVSNLSMTTIIDDAIAKVRELVKE